MAFRRQLLIGAVLAGLFCLHRAPAYAADASAGAGFESLTDGNWQTSWSGYGMDSMKDSWPAGWEFVDGTLHCKGGGVDLKTADEFDSFDLRFDWKISPQGNSGLMYRVSQEADPSYYTGPEYQIIDDEGNEDAGNPATRSGALYDLYPASDADSKPAGEWNSGRIVVDGSHVEHYLNGKKVAEYELGSDDFNQRVAKSKFGAWSKFAKNPKGHVVLQDHGNEVWYRHVRIKPLQPSQGN